MNHMQAIAVLFILSTAASGQARTFIVDATMGAGAHFRDIPAAVLSATDGDRIIVRRGSYSSFTLSKGLAVLGGPGVQVSGVTVSSLPAGRTVLLKDFAIVSRIMVTSTLGLVQLEGLTAHLVGGFRRQGIHLIDAAQVRLSRCNTIAFLAIRSWATLFRCNIDGSKTSGDAMYIGSSNIMAAGCSITAGTFYLVSRSAIYLSGNSSLVLTDDGSSVIATNSTNSSRIPAIFSDNVGIKVLVVDPRVVFRTQWSAPPISGWGLYVSKYGVPFVEATGAPLGGTVRVELKATANDLFFLCVGAPSTPIVFPALRGAAWFDLSSVIVVRSGRLGASGQVTYSTPVPVSNSLFGRTFVWQGLAGASAASMILSNPSSYTHGR